MIHILQQFLYYFSGTGNTVYISDNTLQDFIFIFVVQETSEIEGLSKRVDCMCLCHDMSQK